MQDWSWKEVHLHVHLFINLFCSVTKWYLAMSLYFSCTFIAITTATTTFHHRQHLTPTSRTIKTTWAWPVTKGFTMAKIRPENPVIHQLFVPKFPKWQKILSLTKVWLVERIFTTIISFWSGEQKVINSPGSQTQKGALFLPVSPLTDDAHAWFFFFFYSLLVAKLTKLEIYCCD